MDPLSITTAASSLAIAIFTASSYIHDFIDNAKNVDQRVKDLSVSVDALLTILQAMKNVFDTPGTQAVLKGAKDIGTLLGAVKTSIDDCLVTAEEVESIFEIIAKEKGDSKTLLAKGFRQFKMQQRQPDIDKLNNLIQQHKTNMQLALQTVNVWVAAKAWQAHMDELRRMIKEMRIEQPDHYDATEMNMVQHARALQSTAQFFVSRQATLVAHDDDDWMRISRHSTGFSKSSGKGEESSNWDDVLDSDEEMEADLSSDLLDEGIKLCDEGKYKEAESTLKNSIQDAMRKKLLDRHRAKIKQAQLKLGVAYLWQEKFESADPVLRGVAALPTDIEGLDDHLPLTLEACYNLAQISLAYHDYTSALRDCQKCVKERKKLLGKEHLAYIQALILLVLIQRTSGDQISANAYAKHIPDKMRNDRKGIAVIKFSYEGCNLSVQEEKDAIKLLEGENPGQRDPSGGQTLRWAAFQGHVNIVRLMLYRGAPLESSNYDGGTALNLAAAGNHPHIVKLLIEKGANVNNNFPKMPALHNAVLKDAVECAGHLLDNGAKIDGGEGEVEFDFSIVMSAAYHGSNRCLKLLLERGARADVRNKVHHRSALMYAAREGKFSAVQTLVKAGVKVNEIDKEGQSPLVFAVENRSSDMIRFFLDHGAAPDPPSDAPKFAPTALSIAARFEDLQIVQMLLAKGADPNRQGRSGLGPLVAAADQHKSAAMVKLLLDHGADPNKQVFDHKREATPLYKALNNENEATVKLLLDAGADVNQVSYENCSPLDAAQRRGLENIAELLFDKGATLEGNA